MNILNKQRGGQKYIIVDTESVWDPYLRDAYAYIDKQNDHPRIGCRRLVAISVWPVEIDALGRVSTQPIQTWLTNDGQTEGDVLASAFQTMRQYADHILVGYGSISNDCQIMALAAMSADLELPRQLQQADGPRWRDLRHIDLGLQLKAGGKTWHHMTEVLLRLGLPVGLMLGKADPEIRPNHVPWAQLADHCEKDVILTALVLTAWLRLEGQVLGNIPGMHLALCEAFLRQRPDAISAPLLRRYADDRKRQVAPLFEAA